MAENKQSFLLYCDTIHTVEKLTDSQAGLLFKHLLRYVNDQNPTPADIITEIAFEPIKQSLKRDLKKYEDKREQNKKNALKRWNANASDRIESNTNHAVSDSVSVSVNVSDSVSDNVKESKENALLKSNLFRQPKVPTFQQVHEAFVRQGGTEEMAKVFFEKNSATGWFLNGSPIVNFSTLIPKFINNWKNNQNGKSIKRTITDPAHPDHVRTPL